MPKNFFKTFLAVASIFLFSAGIVNSALAAGCCVSGSTCTVAPANNTCPSGAGTFNSEECAKIHACSQSVNNTTAFPNPIGFTTVSDLLNSILEHLMGIIALIAIIFIIIGGIIYMMSSGNETMVTRAKKTWTGAVIGLAIALASPTFLKEIQKILGGDKSHNAQDWVAHALTIKQIAMNVLSLLLSVIGIIAIIALVVGGGMYLTAYGDERKIDTGKKTITYAIIGIGVSLAALVVVRQISRIIGAP
ncbi:MAG TPA: hypothetical protein ENL05_00380 [Candidatus Moranbacteria bacterium]|nr:hypothetical protein [Candidatus Moranbacteria bacterium]